MKVTFDGPSPVYVPAVGLDLQPGENEVTDEAGKTLIDAGIARAATVARPRRATAPEGSEG